MGQQLQPPDLRQMCRGLTLRDDGIWYADHTEVVSYPPGGHDGCWSVEDESFWFRHRNRCIVAAVRRHHPRQAGTLFEVGAGNGYVARALADDDWPVVAIEPGVAGARHARQRGLAHIVCATTQACGFEAAALPAIGAFDVIEHIEDDVSFVAHLRDLLAPSGHLFVTVPAHAALWSSEDVAAGHFRRYDRRALRKLLEDAGLQPVYASYFFRWLPLPIALIRALPWRLGIRNPGDHALSTRAQHAADMPRMAHLVERTLAAEITAIGRGREMGLGASLIAVARRAA